MWIFCTDLNAEIPVSTIIVFKTDVYIYKLNFICVDEYKLCDDRVEISTPLFGHYCIKGECTEKKQVCIKKVVFIAFRGLFNQNKILIGMSNDTADDIKVCVTY